MTKSRLQSPPHPSHPATRDLQAAWIPLCWLLGSCLAALGPLRASTPCDLSLRLDAVTVSSNFSSVGFPPLISDLQNPAICFGKKVETEVTVNSRCYVCHDQGHSVTMDFREYNPVTGEGPTLTAWSGAIAYHAETNGEVAFDCGSQRIGPDQWTDPACGFSLPTGGDVIVSNRTAFSSTLILGREEHSLVDTPRGTSPLDISERSRLTVELFDPLTLDAFLAEVTDAVLAAPWPDWTATEAACAERGGRNVITWIDDDHARFNAALTKLKYRIAVRGPNGQKRSVSWIERFIPNGGGPVLDTPFAGEITCNGQEQFLPAAGGEEGKVVLPPAVTGKIEVLLLAQWSCQQEGCGPGQGRVSAGSIDLKISLGKTPAGGSAGYLSYHEREPAADLASLRRLQLLVDPSVEIIRDGPVLRQLRAPQTLALFTPLPGGFEIRFHAPPAERDANGYYQPVSQPQSTWQLEQPGGDPARLRVVQAGPSARLTNEFDWQVPEQAWALTIGTLRKEMRTVSVTGASRTETFTVSSLDNQPVYQEARTWRDCGEPLGELLVREEIGGGPSAWTTTWTYHEDPSVPSAYGKLASVTRPDGGRESYTYDDAGRIARILAPFAQTQEGRLTEFSYLPVDPMDDGTREPASPRTVIERVLGQEVRRAYSSFRSNDTLEIRGARPGNAWNAQENLVTVKSVISPPGSPDRLETVFLPDGTLQLTRQSGDGRGQSRVEISFTGAPNSDRSDVVDGTRTRRQFDDAGRILSHEAQDIRSGTFLAQKHYFYPDAFGQATEIRHLDGRSEIRVYDCCHLALIVDRDGIETRFEQDPLGRLVAVYHHGVIERYAYDPADNLVSVRRQGTNGSVMILRESVFDLAGREVRVTDGLSRTLIRTLERPPGGGLIQTTFQPDGGQQRVWRALDGAVLQVSGSGTFPVRYEYGVELLDGIPSLFTREIRLRADGSDSGEWTATYQDFLGRQWRSRRADGSSSEWTYNPAGQLRRWRDHDGLVTLYAYNALGEREYTAIDVDGSDTIDLAGADRVVRTVRDVASGKLRRRTYFWPVSGADTPLLAAVEESSPGGRFRRETHFGQTTTTTRQALGQGVQELIEQTPDGATTVTRFVAGLPRSRTRTGVGGENLGRTDFTQDAHGRTRTLTDKGSVVTRTFDYDAADQLAREVWPAPTGDAVLAVAHQYDAMGRLTRVIFPDGSIQTNEYQPSGLLLRNSGPRIYPVEFEYDSQGRLLRLSRGSVSGVASDSWSYGWNDGWMSQHADPGGMGWSYTHSPEGRLVESRSTRGLASRYLYDAAGDLQAVERVSSADTSRLLERDRLGHPTRATQGTNVLELHHHESGQWLAETSFGLAVTNVLDAVERPVTILVRAASGPGQLSRQDIIYDGASRIMSVSSASVTVSFHYQPFSSRIAEVRYLQNGALRTLLRRSYDSSGRLTELTVAPADAPPLIFRSRYNALDQRIAVEEADGALWDYRYDRLGQLISARHSRTNGTSMAGQQFEYTFDPSGNRTSIRRGGDPLGAGLRQAGYIPNTLLQYRSREITGALDVFGQAPTAARVNVNQRAADRQGTYFHRSVPVDLTAEAVDLAVLAQATRPPESRETSGHRFFPRSPEEFSHDADGNLIRDGRWIYQWDANNQLIGLETHPELPSSSRQRLAFSYDHWGRRVTRTRWRWDPATLAYADREDTRFVYDGWRLLAELNATNGLIRSYVWGPDLSGTLDGAGGVGGLLALRDHLAGRTYFCVHDAIGHVRALVDAEDGSLAARYDYGPFGEPLRATGPAAAANPMRFATKYQDPASELIDFGYRWYNPDTGRWLCRDPLGEHAFSQLFQAGRMERTTHPAGHWQQEALQPPYVYARNDPINAFDATGLDVAYLLDSDAVGRNGHAALLVGDDQKGWLYFSFGTGQCQVNPFGGNRDNLDVQRFNTFAEARSSAKLAAFDKYLRWHSEPQDDQQAVKTARGYFDKAYNLFTCNCDDMVIDAIRSANIDALDQWRPVDTFNANQPSADDSGRFPQAKKKR